jgi:CubicO group peptidase (beta-lactamase class C family)
MAKPSVSAALQRAVEGFQVPGAGVVVVHQGKVVLTETAGSAEFGSRRPVDANTVFPIGSNAKAFTATLLAMLVAEGKIKWDDKVTQHLPAVRFSDPYRTEHATVRDLLGMRLGIASDVLWLGTNIEKKDVLARLPLISPSTGFRENFVYSNVSYLLAGEIIERHMGLSWDEAIKKRIFQPLGMTSSSTTREALMRAKNSVSSHVLHEGKVHVVAHPEFKAVAPSGSINSSLVDMGKWLQFLLSGKDADGKQLLAPELLNEMISPQIVMGGSATYGMGWRMYPTYRGKASRWATHDGSTLGALTRAAVFPKEQIGVVVLANRADLDFIEAVTFQAIDAYVAGVAPKDHVAEAVAARVVPKAEAALARGTPPLPLRQYIGSFSDQLLGPLQVVSEKGGLVVRRDRWVGDLFHKEGNNFTVVWRDPYLAHLGRNNLTFGLSGNAVQELKLFGGNFRRVN